MSQYIVIIPYEGEEQDAIQFLMRVRDALSYGNAYCDDEMDKVELSKFSWRLDEELHIIKVKE